jgi:peptidoglycan/LPS O-acetylase OafA/YrhL
VTGDRLLRIGVGVTALGLVATLIAMLPLVFPNLTLPGIWWFLAMITGVGLALVIAGLARSARERRIRD